MIDINFFEKKQVNVLPYILAGVFIILLTLMGTYFYFTHTYYAGLEQSHNQWIQTNSEDVVFSRQIERFDRLADQSAGVQETLTLSSFPMAYLTEDITSAIPNELDRVSTFQFGDTNQLVLLLENTSVSDASSIINELETRSYVDRVHLLRLENQLDDSQQFLFELTVDINEEDLREVTEQ